jgi:mannose-6-phosphate isomerase
LIQPLKLTAACKDYLWGGTKLRDHFGKNSGFEKTAESWELSCHTDGPSVITETGQTLKDYIAENGPEVLGTNCRNCSDFPVLVKLIDACDDLSVQVHPDDTYARVHEGGFGKTEMWYVIDCEEGASLLFGMKENISKDEFRKRISEGTLLEKINRVPVKKGDVFFITAGTLHAIGKGILIAEIQQNSNITYRIYDYGRKDKNGKERDLHIDKACEVTKLCPAENLPVYETIQHEGYSSRLLASCSIFTVHLFDISRKAGLLTDDTSFEHLLVIDGNGRLEGQDTSMELKKGDSIFIPAGYGRSTVTGNCLIIKTRID